MSYIIDELYMQLKANPQTRRLFLVNLPEQLPRPLPPVIWCLWLQGEDNAPPIVKHCIDSWRRMNPGYDVRVLDEASAADAVSLEDVPKGLPPSAYANMIRNRLLRHHGGIWADATCLCTHPVDQWLPFLMQGGFFAFHRPGPDRIMANWFLASEPGGYLIEEIDRIMTRYWQRRAKRNLVVRPVYCWYHYLIERHYLTRREFRRHWDRIPKLSADGPHLLMRYVTKKAVLDNPRLLEHIPLHKLTWKAEFTVEQVEAALAATERIHEVVVS